MVRGRRGGRRRGARGGGETPPAASTPEGFKPQGGEQVLGHEQIAVGDVVGLIRSFQCMSEALISRLGRDEARASAPAEVPLRAPTVIGSFHREIEKVNFPSSWVPRKAQPPRHGLEKMAMCFALRSCTSNLKVRMAVFHWKGSALLWWKTLLPQLCMAVEDVSWELFEERFQRGIFQRNSLSVSSMSSMPYDREVVRCSSTRHVLWRCSGKLRALTWRSLRSSGSCWALTAACVQGLKV
jgi:hypothetical protein